MDVIQVFRKMEKAPIKFEQPEDFYWFIQHIQDNYPERLFHMARAWKFAVQGTCIGINSDNKQISCHHKSSLRSTLEWDDVKHIFVFVEEQHVDVADLL